MQYQILMQQKGNLKWITSLTDNINVHYSGNFINKYTADKYYDIFEKNIKYNSAEESKIKIFGKDIEIPRKQVGYGEPGTSYQFSGVKVSAKSWSENNILCIVLRNIRHKVETFTGQTFNFVLINRYEDGNQYIGYHSDDEKELGNEPTIVGVSFGAKRDVSFKSNSFIPSKISQQFNLELEHGSIFVMYDPTNTHWKHSIPKRSNIKTPRISLTFRYVHTL